MAIVKKDAMYGVLDQGIISLSNLGIGFLLIKLTSKDNYGLYGIGFAAILLCVGIANALITTQMTVSAPEKADKARYCFSMLIGQYLIFIPLWVLFAIALYTSFYFRILSIDLMQYALVLSATIMASIFHEFMRKFFYVELKPYRVLQIDIINVTLIFSSLLLAIFVKFEITHIEAVAIYGGAAFIAGMVGLLLSKLSRTVTFSEIANNLIEAWQHGLWALGGVIVTWLQSQSYVALLTVMASPASIAEANAAKLFLAPVGVISTSLGQVFIPRLAILKNEGKHDQVGKVAQKIMFLTVGVIFFITLITYLIKDYVIINFFPKSYAHIGSLIVLWAFVFFAVAVRNNAAVLLQIYKRFKVTTVCNFYSALITLVATWLFIKVNGINGSILAAAFGELILALLLTRVFHVFRSRES